MAMLCSVKTCALQQLLIIKVRLHAFRIPGSDVGRRQAAILLWEQTYYYNYFNTAAHTFSSTPTVILAWLLCEDQKE